MGRSQGASEAETDEEDLRVELNEDLWADIFLWLSPRDTAAPARASKFLSAVLRRDGLWNAFAARKAPEHWLVLSSQSPGRERFRRATLLESDRLAPLDVTEPLTCVVTVTSGDTVVFLARFPFAPTVADEDRMEAGMLELACSVEDQYGAPPYHEPVVEPEILETFPALAGPTPRSSAVPAQDNLETTWLLERPDGRVTRLVTFTQSYYKERDCMSGESDPFFTLCTWYERIVGYDQLLRPWRFQLTLSLTFPRSTDRVRGVVAEVELFAANWRGDPDSDDEEAGKRWTRNNEANFLFEFHAVHHRGNVAESFRRMLSLLQWT